ncbi:MAG: enolase C-terminal domain-like protein [Actinomycetota bacterium]|nr:enolase C-terminal domain-like protein [Actinomycetota bacterium]
MNITKINKINIFTFDLKLKKGFVLKNSFIDSRKGILIEFETSRGVKYYGESSPLMHFHAESFFDCLKQISEIREIILNNPNDFNILPFEEKKYRMEDFEVFFTHNFFDKIVLINHFRDIKNILPSVRYCFEMIYFCIFIRSFNFCKYFKITPDSTIPLCRLIPDISFIDYKILEKEISSFKYSVIKIKIGRHELESELGAIKKITDIIESNKKNISIRLDPNMSMKKSEIIRFLSNVNKSTIDFIEDPVSNTSLYPELYEKTGVSIAADETIKEFIDFKKMAIKKNTGEFIKAVIIKPQVIGGFIGSYRLMKSAKALRIKTVASNIFETSLSVSAICIFLYFSNNKKTAAGLDTLDNYLQDPGLLKIKSESAKISVYSAYNNLYQADYSVLKKII